MARLYRLFLSLVITKGRLAGLFGLSAVVIVIGYAIGHNNHVDRLDDGTALIASLGLSLVAPIGPTSWPPRSSHHESSSPPRSRATTSW